MKKLLNRIYVHTIVKDVHGVLIMIDENKLIERQPKFGQWIPVEERLPKEHEIVLVAYLEYISNTKQLCEIAYINEYRTWSWYFNGTVVRNKIIAWMPLPKSYKRSDEDDE